MSIVCDRSASTLASSVELRIRHDILSGVLRPGDKLRIDAVCERYCVGSSPAREALSRLSAEGLVERREQRGFSVSQVDLEDLRELVDTRCQVEGLALRETLRLRTAEWEERLIVLMHRLSRAAPGPAATRTADWEKCHDAYHEALIDGAGARLKRFCQSLRYQANRYRQLSLVFDPTRPDLDEHRAVAEAALRGDADQAVALLEAHYRRTLSAVEKSGRVTSTS
jgi:DNA-binding GntR family transcriptional regulator